MKNKIILAIIILIAIGIMAFSHKQGFPCHPNGDIVPCMHPMHLAGDIVPCGHICVDPWGNAFRCHPNGDIVPCAHPMHSAGDLVPCTHICF